MYRKGFAFLGWACCVLPVWAGRPLTVDDANTNDPGAGHLEMWMARDGEGRRNFLLSPAYAFVEGVELGALLSRDQTLGIQVVSAQVKWLLTKPDLNGCNIGVVAGSSHLRGASDTDYLNVLGTCNSSQWGSIHGNAGVNRSAQDGAHRTWGLALERPWSGRVFHVEVAGQKGSHSIWQFGGRQAWDAHWQLDATWGRQGARNVYSLGLKRQF